MTYLSSDKGGNWDLDNIFKLLRIQSGKREKIEHSICGEQIQQKLVEKSLHGYIS